MFGLEDQQKNKGAPEFVFELEKELKDPKKHREIKKRIEQQIQEIKEQLRGGAEKQDFDQLGLMLHGYTSLLKIMSRFKV
jgi:hypothetical protein